MKMAKKKPPSRRPQSIAPKHRLAWMPKAWAVVAVVTGAYFTYTSQRPILNGASVSLAKPILPNEPILFRTKVSNHGKTTAYNVAVDEMYSIYPVDEKIVFPAKGEGILMKAQESLRRTPRDLAPEQELNLEPSPINYKFLPEVITGIALDKLKLLLLIRIRYRDMFFLPHTARLCFVYRPAVTGLNTTLSACSMGDVEYP